MLPRNSIIFLATVFCFAAATFGQSEKKDETKTTSTSAEEQTPQNYSESLPKKNYLHTSKDDKKAKNKKSNLKDPVNPPRTANEAEKSDEDVVKVETTLVTIPVSVYDRDGRYVLNLQQNDFKIFEETGEQEITYFGASDKPFSVILLLDVSPSTKYKIDDIRRAAAAFVNQLKPEDKIMMIAFDADVRILTKEFTNDRKIIYKAIAGADFGKGTSLYDAVDSSLHKYLEKMEGRKAVVLFTDGVDTTSRANYKKTLRQAEESEALIFPIYYNTFADLQSRKALEAPSSNANRRPVKTNSIYRDPVRIDKEPVQDITFPRKTGDTQAEYLIGIKYLSDLANVTGGRIFQPKASSPDELVAVFESIAEELRRQYYLGYYPKDESQPGEHKKIKVRVYKPNLIIRARDYYIVSANNRK